MPMRALPVSRASLFDTELLTASVPAAQAARVR